MTLSSLAFFWDEASPGAEVIKEMKAALRRVRGKEEDNAILRADAAYLSQEAIRPKGSSRPYREPIDSGKASLSGAAHVLGFSSQAF